MKKYFLCIIILLFYSKTIVSTETTIIELHAKKSLDQLVLEVDSLEAKNEINESNEVSTENIEENEEIKQESSEQSESENDEIIENTSSSNVVDQQSLTSKKLWPENETSLLLKHLSKINSIKSEVLYKEFISILSNFESDDDNIIESEIFLSILKKLYKIGEIQKAYNLLQLYQIDTLEKKTHIEFYKSLELNYLLSTYQLSEACDLKTNLADKNISLPNFLIEKTDIFCLLIEGKIAESELLNSLLLELETENDEYFQHLYEYMINNKNDYKDANFNLSDNYSANLIFLYSAMLRISELPLSEKFLQIDPNNLSIPVILSTATEISTRLKAANKSYLNNSISIESLAALYQSVDFSSAELNKSEETISSLKNNEEILMAFYYQLANVQIFPSERIKVVLDYWDFAKFNGLEKIAFALTNNIITSLDPSLDYSSFGSKIATAHIYNMNYEDALKWIVFYESSNENKEDINKVKFLLDLYISNELSVISDFLKINIELDNNISEEKKEVMYVILESFDIDENYEMTIEYNKVFDSRLMPSIFLTSLIQKKIEDNDNLSILLLALVSLNGKDWSDLHPDHLRLILQSFKEYNNSVLFKSLVIEILYNYKIL
ncbi:MAG: hypothetical protein CFH15_00845 [Alphaproteobacteria bacterium MarineAlpha5_Bin5]|nr:MAG: hypothetical protein CFH15_00845 [Alphaproteobacteria bacterium MarineAlpha5_Bin5]PPR51306.1 MAG: hypothetical protein CFH14_00739 [Alphaproteobacteria bacterium MarineAlpha5_Bin4]